MKKKQMPPTSKPKNPAIIHQKMLTSICKSLSSNHNICVFFSVYTRVDTRNISNKSIHIYFNAIYTLCQEILDMNNRQKLCFFVMKGVYKFCCM